MISCPKCRCCNIIGPIYVRQYGLERLQFRCSQCGYMDSEPTADSEERKQVDGKNPLHRGTSE